jgi:hypothetical protein
VTPARSGTNPSATGALGKIDQVGPSHRSVSVEAGLVVTQQSAAEQATEVPVSDWPEVPC